MKGNVSLRTLLLKCCEMGGLAKLTLCEEPSPPSAPESSAWTEVEVGDSVSGLVAAVTLGGLCVVELP